MKKNIYVNFQAAENWFDMLKLDLKMKVSNKNKIYPCIFIFYVDDCCIFFKDEDTIDTLLKNISKTFKLTYEGGVKYYLGTNVRIDLHGSITTIKPETIDKILNKLGICDEWKIHDTPENVILTKYEDGNGRNQEWHYSSVIGHK